MEGSEHPGLLERGRMYGITYEKDKWPDFQRFKSCREINVSSSLVSEPC